MILRPPRSTRTDTLFPYTTLFRSVELQPGLVSSLRLSLDCKYDYRQVRLFVTPLRAGPAVLQLTGEVSDVAVEEASSGVSTDGGSVDLDDIFSSFCKPASAYPLPRFDRPATGRPAFLMGGSPPLVAVLAPGQRKKV